MTVKELKAILEMCADEQEVRVNVGGMTWDGDYTTLATGLKYAEEHDGILYLMNN